MKCKRERKTVRKVVDLSSFVQQLCRLPVHTASECYDIPFIQNWGISLLQRLFAEVLTATTTALMWKRIRSCLNFVIHTPVCMNSSSVPAHEENCESCIRSTIASGTRCPIVYNTPINIGGFGT